MNTVAVFVDDADQALKLLESTRRGPTRWVLVACAPRLTYRVSKWVSHSSRENWRAKWSDKLFTQLEPWLRQTGDQWETQLAKSPLPELSAELARKGMTIVDARRPKVSITPAEPLADATGSTAQPSASKRFAYPLALSGGMSLVLAMAE